jgi:hypothetical protein
MSELQANVRDRPTGVAYLGRNTMSGRKPVIDRNIQRLPRAASFRFEGCVQVIGHPSKEPNGVG